MSIHIEHTDCCGLDILNGIKGSTPKATVEEVCEEFFGEEGRCAFYVFTDIKEMKFGNALAKYITDNNLGSVQMSETKVNPNSKNRLKAYVWSINRTTLRSYWKKSSSNLENTDNEDWSSYL